MEQEHANPMSLIARAKSKNEGENIEEHLEEEIPFEWCPLQTPKR